jgi:hypothetical protein
LYMCHGKIVSPCGSEPQVKKSTGKLYNAYKKDFKQHGFKPKGKGKGKGKKTVKVNDLDDRSKKKMRETVLAMLTNSTLLTSSTTSSMTRASTYPTGPGPAMFMVAVPVFNNTPPPCCILPVPIQAASPHIMLQLGSVLGCGNCPLSIVSSTLPLHLPLAVFISLPRWQKPTLTWTRQSTAPRTIPPLL